MIRTLTSAIVLAALGVLEAHAQPGAMAPAYSRMRTGADDWHGRGGGYGYGYNFFPPYYYPPVYAGSWYSRPYPYHFDYYRYRWNGNPTNGDEAEPRTNPNCPCAADGTVIPAPTLAPTPLSPLTSQEDSPVPSP
jgi:hypothetical protein